LSRKNIIFLNRNLLYIKKANQDLSKAMYFALLFLPFITILVTVQKENVHNNAKYIQITKKVKSVLQNFFFKTYNMKRQGKSIPDNRYGEFSVFSS